MAQISQSKHCAAIMRSIIWFLLFLKKNPQIPTKFKDFYRPIDLELTSYFVELKPFF